MPHLRFKRHVRFLREGEVVRAVSDLHGGVELPAGQAFDAVLATIGHGGEEGEVHQALSRTFNDDGSLAQTLLARLFAAGLIERYEPGSEDVARFGRQLLFFDTLSPVMDHAENIARQQRLASAHVLVLGLGGIGHQVALSLAAAGVGSITLVDGDVVEESNLHRQVLFTPTDVGRPKVDAARDGLLRVAPECAVRARKVMISAPGEWTAFIAGLPDVRHVFISADRPVQLVNWISDGRERFNYHLIKCGYMGVQGLIGPLLGPGTKGYAEIFSSWAPLIDTQPEAIKVFNELAVAPTMAASNAIMANIAALELIKLITGAGDLTLQEQRLLLDLKDYTTRIG